MMQCFCAFRRLPALVVFGGLALPSVASAQDPKWDVARHEVSGNTLAGMDEATEGKKIYDRFLAAYNCLPAAVRKASPITPRNVFFFDSLDPKNAGKGTVAYVISSGPCGRTKTMYFPGQVFMGAKNQYLVKTLVYHEFVHSRQIWTVKAPVAGAAAFGNALKLFLCNTPYEEVQAQILTLVNFLPTLSGLHGTGQADQAMHDRANVKNQEYLVDKRGELCTCLNGVQPATLSAKNFLAYLLFKYCKFIADNVPID